jgi:hypothetical protein
VQEAAAAAAAGAAPPDAKPPKDKDKAVKELIRSIPRERKDVFAYAVKWQAFDEAKDVIVPKLSKWVRMDLAHLPLIIHPQLMQQRHAKHSLALQDLHCAQLVAHTVFQPPPAAKPCLPQRPATEAEL